ncbi:ASST-domain-containing protein [Aspergillus unguis]
MLRPLLATTALALLNIAVRVSARTDVEPASGWPTEIYRSTSLFGTAVYNVRTSPHCKDGLYTLLSPRGEGLAAHGPTILDHDGELVWTPGPDSEYGETYNLDVQEYKRDQYLTFWEGYNKVDGHGEGVIHMLDSQYIERYRIEGPSGFSADMHEFKITRDDTALITVYDIVSINLTSVGGPDKGWIWDSRFVEMDIETNEVLFEWRASEHFNVTEVETPSDNPGWSYGHPWDFFHIHSVDKDSKGNFLISALHTDHLTYLDGRSGDIIWRLGGDKSDFNDQSMGRASTFAWPHDARFADGDDSITLFDNTTPNDKINRGLLLDLDQYEMTVKLRTEFRAYGHNGIVPESRAQSDGSVQAMKNGNFLVSYGGNGAAWTEFTQMGVPMCHTQYGPLSSFGTGNPTSYRVKKRVWTGTPDTTPAFEINKDEAAVSWNGATEVRSWVLEGAEVALPLPFSEHHDAEEEEEEDEDNDTSSSNTGKSDTYFTRITQVKKEGFETIIKIPIKTEHPYLRVRALDKKGLIIGTSAILPFQREVSEPELPPEPPSETQTTRSPGLFFAGAGAVIGLIVCIILFRRYCWSYCLRGCRRFGLGRYQHLPTKTAGDNWEEYYGTEEQEVGLHLVSDSGSDGSDELPIPASNNPRLSPAIDTRTPSFQSSTGRPILIRTPSSFSDASSREKQH